MFSGWWSREESSDSTPYPNTLRGKNVKSVTADGGRGNMWLDTVGSVAFLADGQQVVSGSLEGTIRCWRVEDGKEVGTTMSAGPLLTDITASRDGRWIVSGSGGGATVWDAESHEKVMTVGDQRNHVVDVSPDGTKIATGSDNSTVCVYSLSTGQRLLGPWEHDYILGAVRFSPDGRFVATATWKLQVRVYDSQDGRLLVDAPITVDLTQSHPLAWTSDSKELFVLSHDGNIKCLEVPTGRTASEWRFHGSDLPKCIVIAGNDAFAALSTHTNVTFWDIRTHKQIGPIIEHTPYVASLAISSNYDLAISGGRTIVFRSLCDILPSPYSDGIFAEHMKRHMKVGGIGLEETVQSLREQEQSSNRKITRLEGTIQQLRNQLSDSQRRTDKLDKSIESLHTQEMSSNIKIARLEEAVQRLCDQSSDREGSLNNTIENLHTKINSLEETVQQLRAQHGQSRGRADNLLPVLHAHEQKHRCETLYSEGRVTDAAVALLKIINNNSKEVKANKLIMDWLTKFRNQCISMLETNGDNASGTERQDKAIEAYSTALSLGPSAPNTLLSKWASMMLIRDSVDKVLSATAKFELTRSVVYRAVCDALEGGDRVSEAVACFQQMRNELGQNTGKGKHNERARWESGFQRRCTEKVDKLNAVAMGFQSYYEATQQFSKAGFSTGKKR